MKNPARLLPVAAAIVVIISASRPAAATVLPIEELSPSFLGMYRKLLEIDDEIRRHAERYGIDVDLARAVCLYESGANPGLASHAGAQGYFQVMPRTYRELGVTTNIEAGVKYLAQMLRQFGREDRAVAAYNGGPGRLGRNGTMPMETLQYVVGVGYYRTVLKQYGASLAHHATALQLVTVQAGEQWESLAARVDVPVWELRLFNPFLSGRTLRPGDKLAHPDTSSRAPFVPVAGGAQYRMRHGDHYIQLAITLGIAVDALRDANSLWHSQIAPVGMTLSIPDQIDREGVVRSALTGSSIRSAAALGAVSTAPPSPAPPAPAFVTHRVKPGETLSRLARRYSTTVPAIQRANSLRGTVLVAGQPLRIPAGGRVTSR